MVSVRVGWPGLHAQILHLVGDLQNRSGMPAVLLSHCHADQLWQRRAAQLLQAHATSLLHVPAAAKAMPVLPALQGLPEAWPTWMGQQQDRLLQPRPLLQRLHSMLQQPLLSLLLQQLPAWGMRKAQPMAEGRPSKQRRARQQCFNALASQQAGQGSLQQLALQVGFIIY